jgi:hypothetical protein
MFSFARRLSSAGLALLLTLAACGPGEPPELRQAADAIAYMAAPANRSRSAFAAVYPEGKPSDYLSYLFSTLGTAEWPPSEDWADEYEIEAARSIRMPLLPAQVKILPRQWKSGGGAQLVVRADDSRGMLILEGYGITDTEPVLRREIKLGAS